MRIRRNANLSSLIFSHAEQLQTLVCRLNQSPWDVIPFSQDTCSSSPIHPQLEGEGSFNGSGSLRDSTGAPESSSFHSLMEVEDDREAMDDITEEKIQCCDNGRDDGKGYWHCENERKRGQPAKKPEKNRGSGRRGQAKSLKKGTASAGNPYEFYYYSGFGPLWGKRRGGGGGGGTKDKSLEIDGGDHKTASYSPSSSVDHFEGADFSDDSEDSHENGGGGKKRMRKPIKARSLKSLM